MKPTMEAKQISTEFWLITIRLSEPNKMDAVRDFIVTEQQLAFLNIFIHDPAARKETP